MKHLFLNVLELKKVFFLHSAHLFGLLDKMNTSTSRMYESMWIYVYFQVKGMKKLDNFIAREDDQAAWRRLASPEDVEYYECQLELMQDLLKSYTNVERVIGKYIYKKCNLTILKDMCYFRNNWLLFSLIKRNSFTLPLKFKIGHLGL